MLLAGAGRALVTGNARRLEEIAQARQASTSLPDPRRCALAPVKLTCSAPRTADRLPSRVSACRSGGGHLRQAHQLAPDHASVQAYGAAGAADSAASPRRRQRQLMTSTGTPSRIHHLHPGHPGCASRLVPSALMEATKPDLLSVGGRVFSTPSAFRSSRCEFTGTRRRPRIGGATLGISAQDFKINHR